MEPVEEGSCYFPRINGALKLRYKAKDPDSVQNKNRWIHVFNVENCIRNSERQQRFVIMPTWLRRTGKVFKIK